MLLIQLFIYYDIFYCGKNASHDTYALSKILSAQYSIVTYRHIFIAVASVVS